MTPSPNRQELPEEISRAIRHLTSVCIAAPGFNDAMAANRNIRNGVEALTAAILSRLGEAEARREEALRERDDARCVGEANARAADANLAAVEAVETARDAALARVEKMEKQVNAALDDACRMSAILLMAGEMTAQERRTARAVANGLAAKVRSALSEAPPQGDQ